MRREGRLMALVAMSRLLALLVATAMLGSSFARELCLVECAAPASDHAAHRTSGSPGDADTTADAEPTGDAHACHDANTSALPSFGSLPHGCDHEVPEPPSVSASAPAGAQCAAAVDVMAATPVFAAPVLRYDGVFERTRDPIPPISALHRADIPLRI